MKRSIPEYYDYIEVDSTRRGRIPEPLFTRRSRLQNIYAFQLQFDAVSDIHVSTGAKEVEEKGNGSPRIIMIQYVNNKNGMPSIPGSSLKGVVSTSYLALTGSGDLTSELFGTTENPAISKVFFRDTAPAEPIELKLVNIQRAWQPKAQQPRSVKVYTSRTQLLPSYALMQCIPKGTRLFTEIQGISLKDFEVGGLLLSLGLSLKDNQLAAGALKVGYGKPQGFGQLELVPASSTLSLIEFKDLRRTTGFKDNLNASSALKKYFEAFVNEVRQRDRNRDLGRISQQLFRRI